MRVRRADGDPAIGLSAEVLGHSAQIVGMMLGDRKLPVLEDAAVLLCRTRGFEYLLVGAPASDIGAQPRLSTAA